MQVQRLTELGQVGNAAAQGRLPVSEFYYFIPVKTDIKTASPAE
jgi:hypothetical protein